MAMKPDNAIAWACFSVLMAIGGIIIVVTRWSHGQHAWIAAAGTVAWAIVAHDAWRTWQRGR